MARQSLWLLMFLCGVCCVSADVSYGQVPKALSKFIKPQTGGGQDLALKAEHGPFLVYAYTVEGEDSKRQAVKLAAELRDSFGLKSYIMPKTLDFSSNLVGAGISKDGSEKVMRYRDDRVVDSYSILVGDFTSAELPETKDTLARVKTIQPNFFEAFTDAESPEDVTSGENARRYRQAISKNKPEKAKKGPMGAAFVIRNPLLPQDFFQAPEMDTLITNMNKKADHSILTCPGRFTVRVATFTGGQSMLLNGNKAASDSGSSHALTIAGEQAHLLADLLRRADVEAYEYHDSTSSSVCVGSFDELGALDANGNFVYMPHIVKIVEQYGGSKGMQSTKYGPLPTPKTLLDVISYKKYPELTTGKEADKVAKVRQYTIAFDVAPKPIFVPRPETKSLYQKALLGKR